MNQPPLFAVTRQPDARPAWTDAVLTIVNVVTALATIANTPRAALWTRLLVLLLAVVIITQVGPRAWRRTATWLHRRTVHRKWAKSWPRFQREVQERVRLFTLTDTRCLSSVLGMLRAKFSGEQESERVRAGTLVASATVMAALSGPMLEIAKMTEIGWPGPHRAKALVNAFETLFDFPERSSIARLLQEHSMGTIDEQLAAPWLGYYAQSRKGYGKFARDLNHEIGAQVYGEWFGA